MFIEQKCFNFEYGSLSGSMIIGFSVLASCEIEYLINENRCNADNGCSDGHCDSRQQHNMESP